MKGKFVEKLFAPDESDELMALYHECVAGAIDRKFWVLGSWDSRKCVQKLCGQYMKGGKFHEDNIGLDAGQIHRHTLPQ